MKEFINKLKKNRGFQIAGKIISIVVTIILFLMLSVVVVQRFSNNRFNLGGYGIYTVATGSMIPVYDVKDLILTYQKNPSEIEIGDDIVYLGNSESVAGKVVTHRVIKKYQENGKYYFNTKGIANELTDPEIDETQILGVVKHKLVLLSFCSHIINNSFGLLFLIVIPFVVFIFFEGKSVIDEAKRS
jgi:signal peptidase